MTHKERKSDRPELFQWIVDFVQKRWRRISREKKVRAGDRKNKLKKKNKWKKMTGKEGTVMML